jgi:septum formation protein
VLGADTIVVLDGELLGKPADEAHAREMLARIAGREHTVHTGVALHQPASAETGAAGLLEASAVETSRVKMAALGSAEIDWYVGTGEPLDKAGSYAVQGIGGLFVESIEGNHHNVVGLPLPLTRRLFARLGYEILDFRA